MLIASLGAKAQAQAAGLHPVRLARLPTSPIGQYMEASLWPQVRRPELRCTISHESALAGLDRILSSAE